MERNHNNVIVYAGPAPSTNSVHLAYTTDLAIFEDPFLHNHDDNTQFLPSNTLPKWWDLFNALENSANVSPEVVSESTTGNEQIQTVTGFDPAPPTGLLVPAYTTNSTVIGMDHAPPTSLHNPAYTTNSTLSDYQEVDYLVSGPNAELLSPLENSTSISAGVVSVSTIGTVHMQTATGSDPVPPAGLVDRACLTNSTISEGLCMDYLSHRTSSLTCATSGWETNMPSPVENATSISAGVVSVSTIGNGQMQTVTGSDPAYTTDSTMLDGSWMDYLLSTLPCTTSGWESNMVNPLESSTKLSTGVVSPFTAENVQMQPVIGRDAAPPTSLVDPAYTTNAAMSKYLSMDNPVSGPEADMLNILENSTNVSTGVVSVSTTRIVQMKPDTSMDQRNGGSSNFSKLKEWEKKDSPVQEIQYLNPSEVADFREDNGSLHQCKGALLNDRDISLQRKGRNLAEEISLRGMQGHQKQTPEQKPTESCKRHSKQALLIMGEFFHKQSPYPSLREFCKLRASTNLKMEQLTTWFNNQREKNRKKGSTKAGVRYKTKNNHPDSAINVLQAWVETHTEEERPTKQEKMRMAKETGLKELQVSYWFENYRRKKKQHRP